MIPNTWYRWEQKDLILQARIQPRARRDELTGVSGDRLRIRITAPPVDGKANTHLVRFLAKLFGVSKSMVTLLHGETSRDKCLRIRDPHGLPALIKPLVARCKRTQ